jgi:hypothetical protein
VSVLANACTGEKTVRKTVHIILVAVVALGSAIGAALAEDTCRTKAIGKDGKPLAGAALNSFMTKCARDACEPKALDKNGKKLSGVAKGRLHEEVSAGGMKKAAFNKAAFAAPLPLACPPAAEIHDLSQQPILSPRQVAHLDHHLRPHPMHP